MNKLKILFSYNYWQLWQVVNFFKLGKQYRTLVIFSAIILFSNMLWGSFAIASQMVISYQRYSFFEFKNNLYLITWGASPILLILIFSSSVAALIQRNQLDELERFRSLPISTLQLFSFKLGDVLFTVFFLLSPFIFIPNIYFVIKCDLSFWIGIIYIISLVSYILLISLSSFILVLSMIWLIPKKLCHLRGLLLLGILITCIIISTSKWWSPPLTENIFPFIAGGFNPAEWCTDVFCYAISGNYKMMRDAFLSLFGLTIALYGIAGLLYYNLYLKRYSYVRGKLYPYESRSPNASLLEKVLTFPDFIWLKHFGTLCLKELRSLIRDRIIWFIFTPIIIVSIVPSGIAFFVTQKVMLEGLLPLGIMLFILSLFMAVSSFGREGQEVAQLSELPIPGRTIIFSKILFYTILNTVFLIIASIPLFSKILLHFSDNISGHHYIYVVLFSLFMAFWSSCLSVLPGIIFPKFNAKMSLKATSWPGSVTFTFFVTFFWASSLGMIFIINMLGWIWGVYLLLLILIWLGVVSFLYKEALTRLEGISRLSRAI
jgi:hypothetical protein